MTGVLGYVPGAFDVFHIGHVRVIERAAERCDRLVVGVVDDDAVERAKGARPWVPLAERIEIVAALPFVDEVVVDHDESKLAVWHRVGFDVLFKGSDWRGTPKGDRLERELATVGAKVCYLPYTTETSSTEVRGRTGSPTQ